MTPEQGAELADSLHPRGQKLSLWIGFLLVAFYLLSSLWIASHRRFWYDEISTVLIARLPGWTVIWKAIGSAADVLPPTYFMLVRLFDGPLGPAEFAARLPSSLALAAGLLVVFDCSRRLTDNLHALAALAVLSCSLLPYYGYEARPYAIYFLLVAVELWLWCHTPDDGKWPAFFFGLTAFLAFSVHYYSALCLIPFGAIEVSRWKPWRRPSAKLLAGGLGVLCGLILFSGQILAARTVSSGFWAPPSFGVLRLAFGEFFPDGLFIGAAAVIWIAWANRSEKRIIEPMVSSERLGWYFFLILFAGFAAAKLVTNAFYNRYFIGLLPGIALAVSCALWRHFRLRPDVSAGIVLLMVLFGAGKQIVVMGRSWAIEPPSNFGGTARLSETLAWEDVVREDGKKYVAVPADIVLGVEARYYSKHPEYYAFVLTPHMTVVGRVHQNIAKFHAMRFWSLEDLRTAARDTALINPSDEILKAMTDAGLQVQQVAAKRITVIYLR
jgi:hypothetical protein